MLYVEEAENALVNAFIKRKDIKLVLLRFSNCLFFSHKHIEETKGIPTFIINKTADFSKECLRLQSFLDTVSMSIDLFYNDSEFNQVYIQQVARCLKLPGALTDVQANTVRDKYVMKQFINSIGWKCPEYRLLNTKYDAKACAIEWGFPFIIKWRVGVSSIEVYTIKDQKDIEQLEIDYSSGKYMAEKFQPDKIWCIDAIVKGGEVLTNLYTWLPFTNLSFAETKTKFVQLAVGHPQTFWNFAPRKITQDIITGLDLKSGYLHLEVFVSDEGQPTICEFAWRTPGNHMLQNFTVLYDQSIEDYLIDVLLDREVNILLDRDTCVADVFLPVKNGTIKRISNICDLYDSCEIIDGEIFYKVGDTLSSQHKYTDSSGWVQLKTSSIEEMMNRIDEVYDAFVLDIEEA